MFCIKASKHFIYSWLSLSRTRLSRITAYLQVKIWSLPKHENLTTGKKYCGKEEKLLQISPLFHNIFSISLTSRVQLHIYLLKLVNRIIFSWILPIWYVEVQISWSISESPLEFEITRVDCNFYLLTWVQRGKKRFLRDVQKTIGRKNDIYTLHSVLSFSTPMWNFNQNNHIANERTWMFILCYKKVTKQWQY